MIGKLEEKAKTLELEIEAAKRSLRQLQTDSKIREKYLSQMANLPSDAFLMEDNLRRELHTLQQRNAKLEVSLTRDRAQLTTLEKEESSLRSTLAERQRIPPVPLSNKIQVTTKNAPHSDVYSQRLVKVNELISNAQDQKQKLMTTLQRARRESFDRIRQLQSELTNQTQLRDSLQEECTALDRKIDKLRLNANFVAASGPISPRNSKFKSADLGDGYPASSKSSDSTSMNLAFGLTGIVKQSEKARLSG